MKFGPLEFRTVELPLNAETCVRFREDSFVVSFGDASRFYAEAGDGAERYLELLSAKIARDPLSAVHIWEGSQIIGQMELGLYKPEPHIGYVNLYYLTPEKRGLGLSKHLDEYTRFYLSHLGLKLARLSVSPTNQRAVRFYEKQGWVDLGPRPGHPEVHFMEKRFE